MYSVGDIASMPAFKFNKKSVMWAYRTSADIRPIPRTTCSVTSRATHLDPVHAKNKWPLSALEKPFTSRIFWQSGVHYVLTSNCSPNCVAKGSYAMKIYSNINRANKNFEYNTGQH